MKALRFFILGLLATTVICRAQITDPGWFSAQNVDIQSSGATVTLASTNQSQIEPNDVTPPPPVIAEAITPEIQALARGLQNDPLQIFNYVHDHIRYVLYYGSKKGAQLTLLEKSGNDFDQCALLVALLRAAGCTNVSYNFGWVGMPYDDPYGSGNDLHHWLNLSLSNTNWSYTSNYVYQIFGKRGYPALFTVGDNNTFVFQRVWVSLVSSNLTAPLDPAFKISQPISGITNLASAMGFSSNALMTVAAGTDAGNYVTGLNEAALRGALTGYTTNLLGYLQTNYPNASVQQIISGQIIPVTPFDSFNLELLSTYTVGGYGTTAWYYEPTNLMSSLNITFAGTNYQCWMPQLEGQRLSLTFDTNGLAQLWQDDTLLAQNSTSGSSTTTNVIVSINHPFGTWNFSNNTLSDSGLDDQIVTNSYQRTNATYALIYAFEPDWGRLRERENLLDSYRQQGLADTSRQVVSETLNIMGLNWMLQSEGAEQLMAAQAGILPQYHHRFGRMAQEAGQGYYVDVYMQVTGEKSNAGADAANTDRENRYFDLSSYFSSALENGIIEQLQSTNITAASTVKMLQIANTNGQAVYLASSTNWSTVSGSLANYNTSALNTSYISKGYYLLLPQNGSNYVASTGSWAGYGIAARLLTSTNEIMTMLISGGYHGGYAPFSTLTINVPYVDETSVNQPTAYVLTEAFTPGANNTIADPVDTADGTFQVEHTDLSLGQAEPRGISLSRYYNNARRYSNPAGLAPGWIHNYYVNAATVAAPQAGLGGTTPMQAAPMFVATCAALGLYNGANPDPKNWMVTALIAKWGIDQLTQSGVSVVLGKDTVQFVKQPNGIYTPPANCTMTLFQTNSSYWLQMRQGNTFKFNSLGYMTNIVDQYNQPLNVAYNASNWVSTITDWKGRVFTFSYTGNHLTSVSDGTRSVYYSFSASNDLASFTDPENKTSTYLYDTNHQITATFDALNQLVVSNFFDVLGHVTTQYTEGSTNKAWQIFWSGWQTIEQDPIGSKRLFFYDDQTRLVGQQDALGNLSQIFYDGQNHVVQTTSPLNETNQFIYDGNNNLVETIDPLGFTNQFIYDGGNNLIKTIDPRGNPSTFGYNSQFSLTGSTNGAGDFVNYTFNTDGTLHTRTDSGGTTTYAFDSYGQLNGITYPGSLGSESFVNSSLGDVTSHTDPRGGVTTFSYNNRRQLTNSVAPTNVVNSIAYDAIGNAASATDARGYVSSNTWSATRQLLATTLPATAAGTPVTTNIYDNRDWLVRSLDPLQSPTLYTNDADERLISLTDPIQRKTTFGYDADSHKIATTNAALEITSQAWDARGKLTRLTDGAGHTVLRAYDGAGNQITLTNRNGKKWQFQFDSANRLTNTITPLGYSTSVTFNHQGLLASMKDPASQTTTYGYDAKGRLSSRADNVATTAYSYDANDNMTNVSEGASADSWTYDAYNRVSSYKDVYGNLIQYRYDGNGNMTNLIYPGGRNVYYSYDSLNHMTNVTDWSGRKTSVVYDLDGRITGIARPNGTYRAIFYDAAGQATNIIEQTALGFPIALFRYNWNNAAEAQWEFAAPLPHTNAPPARTMTYDNDNRLLTVDGSGVTLDSDGNLTSGPLTNDTFAAYTYDARNRLLNVGGVTNAYDPAGNRVSQTFGTNSIVYVVNPNAKLPQVLMRIKNGVTNYYIYGAGLLYQVTESATGTNTLTYHYDYRGSSIALTDNNGNVTDRMEYSLYATLTYRAGTSDTPFLFNGRFGVMTDPNGLLYMRARYYNPYLCRFINPDPSGFSGGLNFYAYANGNPVSYLDPFGLNAHATGDSFFTWLNAGLTIVDSLPGGSTAIAGLGMAANTALSFDNNYQFFGSVPLAINQTLNPFTGAEERFGEAVDGYGYMPGNSGNTLSTGGRVWSGTLGTVDTALGVGAAFGLGELASAGVASGGQLSITGGIQGSRGTYYFGGFEPETGNLYLGSEGHFGGMAASGGTPIPSVTPGISVQVTPTGVIWANDSLSLPRALTTEQMAQVQAMLEAQFPNLEVTQVPLVK